MDTPQSVARSKREFEEAYAKRSRTTVAELHREGRWAEVCDCGEPECSGWKMGHQWEDAIIEDRVGGIPSEPSS